jgi:NAD(P)-dependent dehydrogenase (short-subunit alcohol dehydrogenase family)
MPRFEKQVVLVTGGSSGIGQATAKAFLTEGAKVAISARNLPRLRAATRLLRTVGDVLPIRGDVSKATDARRFARETERRLGPIDVLVNNAGIWIEKYLEAFTEKEYDRVMDINLKGAFLCSKYVLPGMVKRRHGVIVNVSSDSAFVGAPGSAVYGASKAGLLSMTKCMALEHARDGIRVNAICPGEVRTPMMEADARRSGLRFGEYYRRLSSRIPMGRAADPDEIARSILFLASDESSFMTGAAVSVDGGSTAR